MNLTNQCHQNEWISISATSPPLSRVLCPYCTLSLLNHHQLYIHELTCPFKIYFINQKILCEQLLSHPNNLLNPLHGYPIDDVQRNSSPESSHITAAAIDFKDSTEANTAVNNDHQQHLPRWLPSSLCSMSQLLLDDAKSRYNSNPHYHQRALSSCNYSSSSSSMMNHHHDEDNRLNNLYALSNFDHLLAKALLGNDDNNNTASKNGAGQTQTSATETKILRDPTLPPLNNTAVNNTDTPFAATNSSYAAAADSVVSLLQNKMRARNDHPLLRNNSHNNRRVPTATDYYYYLTKQHIESPCFPSSSSSSSSINSSSYQGTILNEEAMSRHNYSLFTMNNNNNVTNQNTLQSSSSSSFPNRGTLHNNPFQKNIEIASDFNNYHHNNTSSPSSLLSIRNTSDLSVKRKPTVRITDDDNDDGGTQLLLNLTKSGSTMMTTNVNGIDEHNKHITKRSRKTTQSLFAEDQQKQNKYEGDEEENEINNNRRNCCKRGKTPEQHSYRIITSNTSQPLTNSITPLTNSITKNNDQWNSLDIPLKLSSSSDERALTPLQCFIRSICIVLFTACDKDVASSSRGKRRPVDIGQVGISCSFCHDYRNHHHNSTSQNKGKDKSKANDDNNNTTSSNSYGGIYYPWKISALYSASMNLIQRHFFNCPYIPSDVREIYCSLKQLDARSGTSKAYWCQAAYKMGLIDTSNGIRVNVRKTNRQEYSDSNPVLTSSSLLAYASFSDPNHTTQQQQPMTELEYLCFPEDQTLTTQFTFLLIRQMTSCKFTEGDRLGKRKELPVNFPGIACRHCTSDFGSGRFFPSTLKTISDTSKTLNVLHRHLLKCRFCPPRVKDELNDLRRSHDTERASMVFGCQKAFFFKVWTRIHKNE